MLQDDAEKRNGVEYKKNKKALVAYPSRVLQEEESYKGVSLGGS